MAVVGAGIAGLTAAALLAGEGLEVVLLEAHSQSGGCAGTFRRGPYTFDVGATQVAGLESGGIHRRLFDHFGLALPAATRLDPGCSVQLAGEREPIRLWRDPGRWRAERARHFPGSERFWDLCAALHGSNWAFAGRDPVLPPRNGWDLAQLLQAIRRITREEGLSAIIVEQHPQAVLAISDHAVVLDRGSVAHAGSAQALQQNPQLLEQLLGVSR